MNRIRRMKVKKLSDLVELHRGYPFRGKIEENEHGDVHVVQLRDAHPSGYIVPDEMIKTTLLGRKKPDWLQAGDVLFAAKGANFFAVLVEDLPEDTVCAPQFYLLKIKDEFKNKVLPAFIGWQLNQAPAQHHFEKTAEGSMYLSIRKEVLESTPITLLSIEEQYEIASLYQASLKEERVLQQMIDNRQQQLKALAFKFLDQETTLQNI